MPPTPTARVLATVAAVAITLAGFLPLAHLHADGDHHPVVHRHVIGGSQAHHDDDPAGHHARVGHADHNDAKNVALSYEHARQFAGLGRPVAATHVLADPDATDATPASRRTLLPTHDPPLRFASSPAPPALV